MRGKILIFNGFYIPAKRCGGPLTSIRNTIDACADEFDFYIIAANHDLDEKQKLPGIQNGWNQVGKAKVKYIADGVYNFRIKRLRALFEEVRPDLIWFSGILHPEIKLCTLKLGKQMHIPVLFSPRGEVSKDRVAIKAYKKVPYLFLVSKLGLYKNAWFHATSADEYAGLQKYIGAPAERISLVANISAAPGKPRVGYVKTPGKLRIAFVSRIHMVKNLKLAVEAVSKMHSEAVFDVYGPLESTEYWNACLDIAKHAPANITVSYKRVLDPSEVGAVFAAYDCFLFPTLNENYGHVIAEALANGCPVVLSKGTTPWDDLDGTAGYVCALDKVDAFVSALEKLAAMDTAEFNLLSDNVLRYYVQKQKKDAAVAGHKKMFHDIIGRYS